MGRAEFEGGEFDWFAVDADGHVGHFSTAGFGPVPLSVLERLDAEHADAVWFLQERLMELPITSEATGHLPGRIDDWLALARRGLFGFDWKHWAGPYQRAATPNKPLVVDDLPEELRQLVLLVEWPTLRLAELESVEPQLHCSCG